MVGQRPFRSPASERRPPRVRHAICKSRTLADRTGPGASRERAPGLLFARLAQYFGEPTEPVVCFSDAGPWGDTSYASLAPSIRSPCLASLAGALLFALSQAIPMPLFTYKLVDTHFVSDFGAHDLPSGTEAQIEAIKLARSLRETRPELVGKGYSIFVIDDGGAAICVIPLDATL